MTNANAIVMNALCTPCSNAVARNDPPFLCRPALAGETNLKTKQGFSLTAGMTSADDLTDFATR